jgi:hypothetical protein
MGGAIERMVEDLVNKKPQLQNSCGFLLIIELTNIVVGRACDCKQKDLSEAW